MQTRNSTIAYGWVSIAIHWLMAITIIAMFVLGLWMIGLSYYDAWYHKAPAWHKSVGILLLILYWFRLGWRLTNPRPRMLGVPWETAVARAVHRLHYILMLILMLSGYLIPTAEGAGIPIFDWFTVPAIFSLEQAQADLIGEIHLLAAWTLMALVTLHSAAAIKHHLLDRDQTLRRMLGIQKNIREDHP